MNLILAQYRASLLTLSRKPIYFFGTIVFPAVFFLFFVPLNVKTTVVANLTLASFTIFAMMGALLFGFAGGIANDRASPWAVYERTLPASPITRLVSRILSGFTFAISAALVMVVIAYLTTPAHLSLAVWGRLALASVAGAIPISLLGLAIGYFASPQGAGPLAQLFYLPLSFLGGLWIPPQNLPEVVQKISLFTPTRHWGNVVWSAVANQAWKAQDFLSLAVFAVIFGALALWGYRRDQELRFN